MIRLPKTSVFSSVNSALASAKRCARAGSSFFLRGVLAFDGEETGVGVGLGERMSRPRGVAFSLLGDSSGVALRTGLRDFLVMLLRECGSRGETQERQRVEEVVHFENCAVVVLVPVLERRRTGRAFCNELALNDDRSLPPAM